MTEKSWPWSTVAGLGDGASELGESDSREMLAAYFKAQDLTAEGVSKGVGGELEVTGAASPLAVATGSAVCYGLYVNTASVNLTVTTPSLGTTGGRVILQTNWAGTGGAALEARTRLKILLNADGVGAIPALTQAFGTTWEISLATFTITTGGVIVLTDDRTFRRSTAMVDTDEIVDDAITAAKIAASAVGSSEIAANAVNVSELNAAVAGNGLAGGGGSALSVNVDGSTIEINADTLRVKDLGITTAKLANNSVDDTKAGDRVPQFYRRQGGSATAWDTAGTTNRTPGAVRMQGGAIQVSLVAAPAAIQVVTFPTAFSYEPLIFLTSWESTERYHISINAVSASQLTISVRENTGASVTRTITVNWLAIGPE